jgi:hypothetical protein
MYRYKHTRGDSKNMPQTQLIDNDEQRAGEIARKSAANALLLAEQAPTREQAIVWEAIAAAWEVANTACSAAARMELQALKAELSRLKQEADNAREIYLRLKKEEVAAGTVLSSVDAYYAGLRVKAALTALSDFVLLYSL